MCQEYSKKIERGSSNNWRFETGSSLYIKANHLL